MLDTRLVAHVGTYDPKGAKEALEVLADLAARAARKQGNTPMREKLEAMARHFDKLAGLI